MPHDPTNPESELRELRAAGLDPSLLDRLEAAADDTWTDLTPLEREFESKLRNTRPRPLNPELLTALEKVTEGLIFPENRTVLPFPVKPPASGRSKWRAVAAVAILGGLSALLVSPQASKPDTADTKPAPTDEQPAAAFDPSLLVPAEFSRNLSETRDEGVIWPSNGQPRRVLKVTYKDRITLKHKDGSTYQVERPRVEYYLVPTESN